MCQVQQWGDREEKDDKECGYDFYKVELFTFLIFYIFLFTFLIVVRLRGVYRFVGMCTSDWGLMLYSLLKYDNTTCSTWVYLRAYVSTSFGITLVGVCGYKGIKLCFMGLSWMWCLLSHILWTWFGFGLCIRGPYTMVWCFPIGTIIHWSVLRK